mmetsp:Transcript_101647/g.175509  ORF Transcript_101647/g.175509 Transcript_101647/m.175509 type:complete len:643 (-) Transcript_101647:2130-4058(-)
MDAGRAPSKITLPLPYPELPEDCCIVDTPGISDVGMTEYVERWVATRPCVFVYCIRLTDGGANLEKDLNLLEKLRCHETPQSVIFVLTDYDTLCYKAENTPEDEQSPGTPTEVSIHKTIHTYYQQIKQKYSEDATIVISAANQAFNKRNKGPVTRQDAFLLLSSLWRQIHRVFLTESERQNLLSLANFQQKALQDLKKKLLKDTSYIQSHLERELKQKEEDMYKQFEDSVSKYVCSKGLTEAVQQMVEGAHAAHAGAHKISTMDSYMRDLYHWIESDLQKKLVQDLQMLLQETIHNSYAAIETVMQPCLNKPFTLSKDLRSDVSMCAPSIECREAVSAGLQLFICGVVGGPVASLLSGIAAFGTESAVLGSSAGTYSAAGCVGPLTATGVGIAAGAAVFTACTAASIAVAANWSYDEAHAKLVEEITTSLRKTETKNKLVQECQSVLKEAYKKGKAEACAHCDNNLGWRDVWASKNVKLIQGITDVDNEVAALVANLKQSTPPGQPGPGVPEQRDNQVLWDILRKRQYCVPKEYLDPITREVMKDPVIVADGRTFDRTSITSQDCIPNYPLQAILHEYTQLSAEKKGFQTDAGPQLGSSSQSMGPLPAPPPSPPPQSKGSSQQDSADKQSPATPDLDDNSSI